MSFKDYFINPPKKFRPMPFYFLNHTLEKDELSRQIKEMDEKGLGGAILHARHGLLTKFMSEEWLDAILHIVSEFEKRGMDAWLYDEDNWPSGTSGGMVTKEFPQYRMRFLRIEEADILYPDSLFDDNILIEKQKGITKKYLYFWECPLSEKATFYNSYYLDTMDFDACKKFIELSYDPYDNKLLQYYGTTIKGVFTDEPGLMSHEGFFGVHVLRSNNINPKETLPGYILPWSRNFIEKFKAINNYDIVPHLSSLIYDIGDYSKKIKKDFYNTITYLYTNAYHCQIKEWCSRRNLKYIGHTLEEPLWGQVRSQGNQTEVLKYFDYPGLDYLSTGVGTKDNPHRILSVKCASSLADTQVKERVMCECFGGTGHGHSIKARLKDAGFMAVLGVNMFINHAFYYSFAGYRKADWPPTEFYHSPYWESYREWSDYLGRLSLLSAEGKRYADVAIIPPVNTVYQQMFTDGSSIMELECDRLYSYVSDRLLRHGFDYHYLDESQIHLLQCYKAVILPGNEFLDDETISSLERFNKMGGKIVTLGSVHSSMGKISHHADDEESLIALVQEVCSRTCNYRTSENIKGEVISSRRDTNLGKLLMFINISDEEGIILIESDKILVQLDLETGNIYETNNKDFNILPGRALVLVQGDIKGEARKSKGKLTSTTDLYFQFEAKNPNILPLSEWKVSMKPGMRENVWSTEFVIKEIPDDIRIVFDETEQFIVPHHGHIAGERNMDVYINGMEAGGLLKSCWQDPFYLSCEIAGLLIKGTNRVEVVNRGFLTPMTGLNYPPYIIGNFSLDKYDSIIKPITKEVTFWNENGYPYYSGTGIYKCKIAVNNENERIVLCLENVNDGMRVYVNEKLAASRLWEPWEADITGFLKSGDNEIRIEVFNSLDNLYNRSRKISGISKAYLQSITI